METNYFRHPRRFPKNAVGPFYTTGYQTQEADESDAPKVWCGDCLQCEAPEAEAPDLLSPLTDDDVDTYYVRQPKTNTEVARACMAARVCCVSALRYGGHDRSVIEQLQNDPDMCDYVIRDDGELQLAVDADGDLQPFAQRIVEQRRAARHREYRKRNKKWWQFWL